MKTDDRVIDEQSAGHIIQKIDGLSDVAALPGQNHVQFVPTHMDSIPGNSIHKKIIFFAVSCALRDSIEKNTPLTIDQVCELINRQADIEFGPEKNSRKMEAMMAVKGAVIKVYNQLTGTRGIN